MEQGISKELEALLKMLATGERVMQVVPGGGIFGTQTNPKITSIKILNETTGKYEKVKINKTH